MPSNINNNKPASQQTSTKTENASNIPLPASTTNLLKTQGEQSKAYKEKDAPLGERDLGPVNDSKKLPVDQILPQKPSFTRNKAMPLAQHQVNPPSFNRQNAMPSGGQLPENPSSAEEGLFQHPNQVLQNLQSNLVNQSPNKVESTARTAANLGGAAGSLLGGAESVISKVGTAADILHKTGIASAAANVVQEMAPVENVLTIFTHLANRTADVAAAQSAPEVLRKVGQGTAQIASDVTNLLSHLGPVVGHAVSTGAATVAPYVAIPVYGFQIADDLEALYDEKAFRKEAEGYLTNIPQSGSGFETKAKAYVSNVKKFVQKYTEVTEDEKTGLDQHQIDQLAYNKKVKFEQLVGKEAANAAIEWLKNETINSNNIENACKIMQGLLHESYVKQVGHATNIVCSSVMIAGAALSAPSHGASGMAAGGVVTVFKIANAALHLNEKLADYTSKGKRFNPEEYAQIQKDLSFLRQASEDIQRIRMQVENGEITTEIGNSQIAYIEENVLKMNSLYSKELEERMNRSLDLFENQLNQLDGQTKTEPNVSGRFDRAAGLWLGSENKPAASSTNVADRARKIYQRMDKLARGAVSNPV